MPALKIGLQLAGLRLPLREALPVAAEWGVQAIELDARRDFTPQDASETALRQLRKMLGDYRLRVSAVAYPTRRGYDVSDELERRIDGTKWAMKLAGALGAAVVINRVGELPAASRNEPATKPSTHSTTGSTASSTASGESAADFASATDEPGYNLLLSVLSDLGRYGQHIGAFLAAETGADSPDQLAMLLDALPMGSLVVDLNPGNLLVHGHLPLAAIEKLGPHIMHVHATDGVRDRSRGRGERVPLGRGMADWPALLGALEERDYRGDFTIERSDSDDPQHEMQSAVKFLRNM